MAWFGVILLLLGGFNSLWLFCAGLYYILLFCCSLLDWKLLPNRKDISAFRAVEDTVIVGETHLVHLSVHNRSKRAIPFAILDTPAPSLNSDLNPSSLEVKVPPGHKERITYSITPVQRGDYRFGDIYLRCYGPLRLIGRDLVMDAKSGIRVYPPKEDAARFTLLAKRNRLSMMGMRSSRMQGIGKEFESLREYVPDDEMRRVDWKATARSGKLISRNYEVERAQTIIILLDTGRTMQSKVDGKQKLDYAINAALLLAKVAAEADDRVGMLVFSDKVHAYYPPEHGRHQVQNLTKVLYNVQASERESNYSNALGYLQKHWRKRSLVICFTDLWDPDSADQTIRELSMLRPRHLPIAVTLQDPLMNQMVHRDIVTRKDVFRKAVAIQMQDDRKNAIAKLTSRRVGVVDAPADQLSIELVNRYLQIKANQQL